MAASILRDKSYHFAISIVQQVMYIRKQKNEYDLTKQLVRSWTAVWALLREAEFAQSKADFIHKLSVSLKEANETRYRLDILCETWYIEKESHATLSGVCEELIKMLVASIKSNKKQI